MLQRELSPQEFSKMYRRVCELTIRDERNEHRFQLMFQMLSDLLKAQGSPSLDMERFDQEMGFSPEQMERRLVTEYYDLDLGDDQPAK